MDLNIPTDPRVKLLQDIRNQGAKQIELLTAIKGLLERMAPAEPTAPPQPDRSGLAFIDE